MISGSLFSNVSISHCHSNELVFKASSDFEKNWASLEKFVSCFTIRQQLSVNLHSRKINVCYNEWRFNSASKVLGSVTEQKFRHIETK